MRVINFNAGPSALPLPALERAKDELLEFEGTGMSILEHSHRGKAYDAVHHEVVQRLTELLGIPDSHQVLFLQGGASLQFAMVPLNFLPEDGSADYVLTGGWSEKALAEARCVGNAREAASTRNAEGRYTRIPRDDELKLDPSAAYVHLTSNNTLFGTEWQRFPDTGAVPLVVDMSSDFLSRPCEVGRFHLIYAGAQKNVGPSGVTVVIVRKDWLPRARTDAPKILRYQTHAAAGGIYNTPNTFGVYLMRNVLTWIADNGGLSGMEARNAEKADILHGALERMKDFYRAPVEPGSRSRMNVVFRLPSESLEATFVEQAAKAGMVGLKGHRSTGGIRVSTYNAVSAEDVRHLVAFLERFASANG